MFSRFSIPGPVRWASFALALPLLLLLSFGCNDPYHHTADSSLRQIDEMLNTDLPKGTTKQKVVLYLTSRGFEPETLLDRNAIVATVSHIDTDTLQPSSAEVTFSFDSGNNLISYEMHSANTVLPMH
jgi:hypothetical protein